MILSTINGTCQSPVMAKKVRRGKEEEDEEEEKEEKEEWKVYSISSQGKAVTLVQKSQGYGPAP